MRHTFAPFTPTVTFIYKYLVGFQELKGVTNNNEFIIRGKIEKNRKDETDLRIT